jgi:hypothetical protein
VAQDDAIFGCCLICHGKLTAIAARAMGRQGRRAGDVLGTRMTQPYAKEKWPCRPTHAALAGDRDHKINSLNDFFIVGRGTCCPVLQG